MKNTIISGTKISAVVKIIFIVVIALIVLHAFDINITGLVAFGGIGGIAVGFAARDLLANFFGALMIYFDKPFLVGDLIRSPDRQIEGTVEHIGWRLTYVRTPDKRMLYIPNSIFSTIMVENTSRMISRHINESVKLRYEDLDKVEKITVQIREILMKHNEIDRAQGVLVFVNKFSDVAIEIIIDAFTYTKKLDEFCGVKQNVLLKVAEVIKQNGAQIAVQNFYLKKEVSNA